MDNDKQSSSTSNGLASQCRWTEHPGLSKLAHTITKEGFSLCPISTKDIALLVNKFVDLLFPQRSGNRELQSSERLIAEGALFAAHLESLLGLCCLPTSQNSADIANSFLDSLLPLRNNLLQDALAHYDGDPAASSIDEVILTYPGFFAIAAYRLAHNLNTLGVNLLPRMVSEYAHGKTGIDIHPSARIAVPFSIDHGTGVVVGATTDIGRGVKIYQGVTLGALSVRKEESAVKRHPTVEDNVVIYANATILGGNTIIGHDSIIGGNAWVTSSVEPFSRVYRFQDRGT